MTKVTAPTMANSKKQIAPHEWRQIGGDVNPGRYGAVVARFDGEAVDIFEIQPVLEHESNEGAAEVGFPFWSRAAYYDADQLQVGAAGVDEALRSCGLEKMPTNLIVKEAAAEDPLPLKLAIAECLLRYGHGVDEGPSGWGSDVLPDEPVHWWAEEEPKGQDYFNEDDADFRREVLGEDDTDDDE